MGDFKNGITMRAFATFVAFGIIAFNMYFVYIYVQENVPSLWYAYFGIAIAAVIYFTFISYLMVYLLICMGWESLTQIQSVKAYYNIEEFLVQNEPSQDGTYYGTTQIVD